MEYELRRCLHISSNVDDQFEVINCSDAYEKQIITWTKYKGSNSYVMQAFSSETKELKMDEKFAAFWTYVDAFQNVLSYISSAENYERSVTNEQ